MNATRQRQTEGGPAEAGGPEPGGPRRKVWRRAAPYVALLLLMVVLGVVEAQPDDGGLPLDPRSAEADGTAALLAVLSELGTRVDVVDRPGGIAGHRTVLVLADPGRSEWDDAFEAAVADGATLVSTDPTLTDLPVASTWLPPQAPECALQALDGVDTVSGVGGTVFEVPEGATGCFPAADGLAWMVVRAEGAGRTVALGGGGFLTNASLDEADNALLAAALLAGGDVAVVGPAVALAEGAGDASLLDLVPGRIRWALVQLLVALVVVVLWRARRLGPPVEEPLPVEIAGSELVRATGELLHQAGAHAEAARRLSSALADDLARRTGARAGAEPAQLVPAASQLTGWPPDRLRGALAPGRVAGSRELVDHAREVAALRHAAGLDHAEPPRRGGPQPTGSRSHGIRPDGTAAVPQPRERPAPTDPTTTEEPPR